MERRNLPWDLIEEILSRVPAKSLARLRSTSKQWNTLLKSGRFVRMHSANAPKESLIIMLMDEKVYFAKANLHGIRNKVASKFNLIDPHFISPQVYIRDVFHCHGLLLCTTCNNRLVVCNPCSGETKWITLRNGYKTFDLYALGYDNKSLNYKVLRVDCQGGHFPGMGNNYEIEIYDFTTDSWRVLDVGTGGDVYKGVDGW
ncbi:putative F-box protein [Cardamine amara subsp. amara]|uniref:F-box protein n=1 Tax=Cardamine amara subsp. amara TaxID=228776 RepID=A0ABD1BHM8_CARAN